ncbi:hypothetical protein LB506_008240 [Fusarium annulatum]|nr:hypothetical protein LB506_008240 [Fusarium annulatum]
MSEVQRVEYSRAVSNRKVGFESGLDRYRMQLTTYQRNRRHLEVYYNAFKSPLRCISCRCECCSRFRRSQTLITKPMVVLKSKPIVKPSQRSIRS